VVPAEEGRPKRRYYRLTEDGAERARIALAQAATSTAAFRLQGAEQPLATVEAKPGPLGALHGDGAVVDPHGAVVVALVVQDADGAAVLVDVGGLDA